MWYVLKYWFCILNRRKNAINSITKKATPYVGKKIANSTSKGIVQGAEYGTAHGTLTGLINEDKNPIQEGIKEGIEGAVVGGITSFGIGKAIQKAEGENLKNLTKKPKTMAVHKYYADYEQGIKINNNEIGKIITPSGGFKENTIQKSRVNDKNIDKVIGLSKALKKAKYLYTKPSYHNHAKYDIVKFHTLKGEEANYKIAENKKRGQIFL